MAAYFGHKKGTKNWNIRFIRRAQYVHVILLYNICLVRNTYIVVACKDLVEIRNDFDALTKDEDGDHRDEDAGQINLLVVDRAYSDD